MDNAGTRDHSPSTWLEYDAQDESDDSDLALLPAAVRAIVEECRAQSRRTIPAAATTAAGNKGGAAQTAIPYPCHMYEKAMPGEEDMLQLQWMRVDMSCMDSERCWGETSQQEEYDCGPDSGLVLPMVYSLDPAQLLPLTPIGLPPELQRSRHSSSSIAFEDRAPDEEAEDHLLKLGRNLTEALSSDSDSHRREEGLPPEVIAKLASISGSEWSFCLERYVDLRRCDPAMVARVLSTAPLPTLDCLLGTVLPAVITKVSNPDSAATESASQETAGRDGGSDSKDSAATIERKCEDASGANAASNNHRGVAAVHAICNLAASVAASTLTRGGREEGKADHVRFREKVSGSELRKLGPLGREAEVALAESFFYGNSTTGTAF